MRLSLIGLLLLWPAVVAAQRFGGMTHVNVMVVPPAMWIGTGAAEYAGIGDRIERNVTTRLERAGLNVGVGGAAPTMFLHLRFDGLSTSLNLDGQKWYGYMSLELSFDWMSEIGDNTYFYKAVLWDDVRWVPCLVEETAACLLSHASELVESFVTDWKKLN